MIASLTRLQAYRAMFRFLEDHWERTQSEEVGALLGSMSLSICGDGNPGDPAMKEDWDDAVDAILNDIDADQWVDPKWDKWN